MLFSPSPCSCHCVRWRGGAVDLRYAGPSALPLPSPRHTRAVLEEPVLEGPVFRPFFLKKPKAPTVCSPATVSLLENVGLFQLNNDLTGFPGLAVWSPLGFC